MNNLYEILGVSQDAPLNEIKRAYKTAAKLYHPDLPQNRGNKEATQKMQEINDAFAVLKDGNKRHEYDEKLRIEKEQAEQGRQQEEYNNQNSYSQQNNQQYYNQTNNQQNDQQYYDQQYNYQNNNEQYNQAQDNYYNAYTQENSQSNYSNYSNENDIENDEKFRNLSPKEQERIKRKIEKKVQEEYQRRYENYLRNLGYRVKHRITFKDILKIMALIGILILIFLILWIIPATKKYMIDLYNSNIVIKIIVNLLKGILVGIGQTIKGIFTSKSKF